MNYQKIFNAKALIMLCITSVCIMMLNACKKDKEETVNQAPAVTGYYPNSGNKGTLITVEGTGFGNKAADVSATFGGAGADIVSVTPTAVVLRAPASGTTGSIALKINSKTLTVGQYTYQELSVHGITPVNGAAGTHIRITGAGFSSTQGPAEVFVNGKPALVVSAGDTLLVAEVPVEAGTGPVTIKVNGAQASGQVFKFQAITSIKPATGGKGTRVKISGSGFDEVKEGNLVDFNGKPALVTEVTPNYLMVVAPDGVQTGPVSVTINRQKATGPVFTIVPMPKIETVTPLSGPAGTVMTITGLNFSTFNDENVVTINGKNTAVLTSTQFKITLTIPGGTGNGKVVLNVNDQIVQGPDFKDQTLGVSSLSPDNGLAGTQVTINGTGFNTNAASNRVTFNGQAAQIVSATATSLVVIAPPTLTSGPVVVSSAGQSAPSPTAFSRAGVMTLAGGPGSTDFNIRDRGAALAVDSHGNVFMLDFVAHCVRKITPQGSVSVFAGTPGQAGNRNGTGTEAQFSLGFNSGIVVDKQDNLYLSDLSNNAIRKVTPAGVVSNYATNMNQPGKLAINSDGILYVQTAYSLTRVDKSGIRSQVSSFYGARDSGMPAIIGSYFYYQDNDALYISRFNLNTGENIRSYAGDGNFGNSDGNIKQSMLFVSSGMVADDEGNIYFSDQLTPSTRKINTVLSELSTISTQPSRGYKDGALNEALFNGRGDMAIDREGNLYIIDAANNAVRKMFLK